MNNNDNKLVAFIPYLIIVVILTALILPFTTHIIVINNISSGDKIVIGTSSWYDYKIIGKYGYVCKREIEDCYTEYSLVGASRDFPRYSLVEVCSLNSSLKCVVVRITDWVEHPDRVIDLSSYAFGQLAPLGVGLIEVKITQVNE